jgi:hypothetical protein
MGSHQSARMGSDAWLTPPDWIGALGGPESFDLDPCAAPHAPEPWPTARTHYRQAERDGLRAPWFGRVWVNPPYGTQAERWVARLAEHGRGTLLVAARTETRTWRRHIWGAATGVLFVDHRPHFHRPDGTRAPYNSGTPVALIAYGADDANILRRCRLSGTYIPTWDIPLDVA